MEMQPLVSFALLPNHKIFCYALYKKKVFNIVGVCIRALIILYANRVCYVPQCYLWPVCLCNIFPHYVLKGTIFGGGGYLT